MSGGCQSPALADPCPPADGIIDLVRPVVALKVCSKFVLRKFGSERAYFATDMSGGVAEIASGR
jgi:hypothetical protein